jgi:hypothetical protein
MPDQPLSPPISTDGVVASLQRGVSLHLTAIENYEAQAAHFGRWGYSKLAERFKGDAKEERGHLRALMERLEYYDVQPTYEHQTPSRRRNVRPSWPAEASEMSVQPSFSPPIWREARHQSPKSRPFRGSSSKSASTTTSRIRCDDGKR